MNKKQKFETGFSIFGLIIAMCGLIISTYSFLHGDYLMILMMFINTLGLAVFISILIKVTQEVREGRQGRHWKDKENLQK